MDMNLNKKEQFAKQKASFSEKMAELNLDVIKFIKKGAFEFGKSQEADFKTIAKQAILSKGLMLDRDIFNKLTEKLKEFKEQNPAAQLFKDLKFASTLGKGDKFNQIKGLNCVLEDKIEALEHKPGMVYLIDFWATWCGPCQNPMVIAFELIKQFQQHNQEMLEKNAEKWKDKVEIVGVSIDEKVEDVKKRVEAKNWKLVRHYQNPVEENLSIFDIDGIPTIYIIDQQGTVAYYGHPMSINVEEFINKLLEKGQEVKPKKEGLVKEKFNKMKAGVEELLKTTIAKEDKFVLKIEFIKKKMFDSKWNLIEKKYNIPTLTYETTLKHNQKLQKILVELYAKYPKTEFKIVKEQVIDKQASTENCIKFAGSELLAKGLGTHQLALTHIIKLKFVSRNKAGMFKKMQSLGFSSQKPFPPTEAQKVKEFNESMSSFKKKAKFPEDVEVLRSLVAQSKIAAEDPYSQVKGYKVIIPEEKSELESEKQEKVEEKKEMVTIEHIPGQVLLVDFWATWCPPCQGPMQHNQDMLIKHKEEWGNKVRIVAASLDQEAGEVVERVKSKKWTDIEHIILNNEELQASPRLYGIRGIPFIVVVNKKGIIKYMGHPSSIKVEEFLQKMLDEEESKEEQKLQEEEKQPKGTITEDQYNKIAIIQKEYLPIIREKIKNEEIGPSIILKIAKQIKYDLLGNAVGHPSYIAKLFSLKMYEKQYQLIPEIQQFMEKILNIVKKEDFETDFKLELERCIDIEFGKECDNCKKHLSPADKQYYCHFHKLWFCYECGNKTDETKKGNAKYIHPCNMVYINVVSSNGMKNIDEYKFGKNIQFDENEQSHSYSCNGCSGCGLERYICLTCRPGPIRPGGFVDFCEKCVKVSDERDAESDEYKKFRLSVENEQHDEKTHLLLRILFSKGNYPNY